MRQSELYLRLSIACRRPVEADFQCYRIISGDGAERPLAGVHLVNQLT